MSGQETYDYNATRWSGWLVQRWICAIVVTQLLLRFMEIRFEISMLCVDISGSTYARIGTFDDIRNATLESKTSEYLEQVFQGRLRTPLRKYSKILLLSPYAGRSSLAQNNSIAFTRSLAQQTSPAFKSHTFRCGFHTTIVPPCGHIGWLVEYDGEWGCTQFAEEIRVVRLCGRAVMAKLALLSEALVTFPEFSDGRDGVCSLSVAIGVDVLLSGTLVVARDDRCC
jgi:hypothetical protein